MPKLHEYKPFEEIEKCQNTDDYFCKCKSCKNAINRANYIFQRQLDEIKNDKLWRKNIKDCETSKGKLTCELMKEII